MTEAIVLGIFFFIGMAIVTVTAVLARKNYDKHVAEEREVLNNIVSLVNSRNLAVNKFLQDYVRWLNEEYNKQSIDLVLKDTYLMAMKEKYNINDTEYVLAFQNVIAELQNVNMYKTQELLTNVSNSMIEAVKKQLGETNNV